MADLTYVQLAEACFDNDCLSAELGITLDDIINRLDQDGSIAKRIAEQRALRLVVARRGEEERKRMQRQAYLNQFTIEDLDPDEREWFIQLTAIWLDGFATLLKAQG